MYRELLDFFFPRFCIMCEKRLALSENYICVGCLRELNRIEYEGNDIHGNIERLFWGRIPIERATSMFLYEGEKTRRILHNIKYFDKPEVATILAKIFVQENRESGFFDDIDMIIPVPLARKKQRKRGYNQCDYIAKGLCEETAIPVRTDIARRVVNNPTQTHLSTEQRKDNVKNIFQIDKLEELSGKHVLIIDDVITTGSTILSLAEEIAKAEDVRISIFSLAFAGELRRTNMP